MTRHRPAVHGLLVLLVLSLLAVRAGPATAATNAETVAAALQRDPVYVDPAAEQASKVDADAVRAKIRSGSAPVVVAVLPTAAATAVGGAQNLPPLIGQSMGRPETVAVVAGTSFQTWSSALATGAVGRAASESFDKSKSVTTVLVDFVGAVQAAPKAPSGGNSGAGASGGSGSVAGSSGGSSPRSGGSGTVVVLVLLVLGALGLGGVFVSRRRRRERDLANTKADVRSVLDRLGGDVTTLNPGDNAVAQQAINDASERYTAAGGMIASADTPEKLAVVRRTALEGLAMTRAARTALGFDPGPEIEPATTTAQKLTAAERVRVGDRDYDGYPGYTPGAPHYFGGGMVGGGFVPGGWYAMPFWEGMMLGGMMGGGFGGGWGGGGGYERGYDSGYDEGREDAGDRQDGGNWGGGDSGGGGDRGGGDSGDGGDWGGGGDFGGGGDVGGGDSGGGGSW